MVESTRMMQVDKLLRERDIRYEVITSDAFSLAGTTTPRRVRSPEAIHRIMRAPIKRNLDWKFFYPLHVVYNFIDELERCFPSTCTVCVIGKSVEGRDIKVCKSILPYIDKNVFYDRVADHKSVIRSSYMRQVDTSLLPTVSIQKTCKLLKISNSNANNTGIWIDATTHAREWVTTSVVTYIADYIARNFVTLPEYITNKDWYFLPVVNPDGYNYSHTQDRMWRKNRGHYGNACQGVDLNRNFSYNWSQNPPATRTEVTVNDPASINYPGPEPFSEPETVAIKDMILYSRIPFKVFLSFHSCSEVISFPWCHTHEPCPDYVTLLEGATAMAKAMYETSGRMYKVGSFRDIMYHASGTSIDWSYGVAHIPFSYLIELRSKHERFLLPQAEIIDCCKETLNGVLALIDFADQKKCLNCTIISKSLRR